MLTIKKIVERLSNWINAPLVGDGSTVGLDLTADDLIADLDPGWLDWRRELEDASEPMREVA